MEIKVWDCSFSKEDIESLMNQALSEGEWNIVVDELYNNDYLYDRVQIEVLKVAKKALE